jgi:hypothetical protein
MFDALQVVFLILVVLAMVPAFAHALELPGKLQLTKDAYFAVQPIYFRDSPSQVLVNLKKLSRVGSSFSSHFPQRAGVAVRARPVE